MIPKLPRWYKIASIDEVGEETIKRRAQAISQIVATADLPFIFECIRLFLAKPTKDKTFSEDVSAHFQSFDNMLIDSLGPLETRVLAGAIVSEFIKVGNDKLKAALTLQSASFGVEANSLINTDIIDDAVDFIYNEAVTIRQNAETVPVLPKYPVLAQEASYESLASHVKGLSTYIKSLVSLVESQNRRHQDQISALEEQSNIHWWMFRGYSDVRKKSIGSLEPQEAPFILVHELYNQYHYIPIPSNVQTFLAKIFNEHKKLPRTLTMTETVSILHDKVSDIFVEKDVQEFTNLTPIHFAYSKALESGLEGWMKAFEKQTGISSEYECTLIVLSMQLIIEKQLYDL